MKKLLKVLHIEDRFHPAYGYQLNNFAALHDSNIDFHILTSKSLLPWHVSDAEHVFTKLDKDFEDKYDVQITRLDILFEIESRVWLCDLKKSIYAIDPDIIYVHGVESFTALRLLFSHFTRERLVVSDTHNLPGLSKNKFLATVYYFFFQRVVVPVINRKKVTVFYTCDENAKMLRDQYGIDERNIKGCVIGTNPDLFYFHPESRTRLRTELGIGSTNTVLIYSGKLDSQKQPHLILEAVKRIEADIKKPFHLLFVGSPDTTYKDAYCRVDFQNPNIVVHFVEAVCSQDLFRYYSAADFAVFPKKNTLSSLDVQVNGLPVIMEDDTTNRSRLLGGGRLYREGDLDDLSKKILELVDDSSLRKRLSQDGRMQVLQHFNYKKIVSHMETYLFDTWQELRKNMTPSLQAQKIASTINE